MGTGSACSQAQPCSLTQAKTAVQTLAPTLKSNLVVTLADGKYALTAPLVFTAADSPGGAADAGARAWPSADAGASGPTIAWQAATGAHPVISGATKVTGWTNTGSNGIWKATAPGTFATRQLYVDGRVATRARMSVDRSSLSFNNNGFTGGPSSLGSVKQQGRAELHAVGSFTDRYAPVMSFSGGSAAMMQPAWTNNLNGYDTIPNSYRASSTWIENAYEFLDSPGEWYQDTIAGVLYYIPLSGQDMTTVDVELPQVQVLLAVGGTSLDEPAHDLGFTGLTFSYSSWTHPSTSDGYPSQQTGAFIHGDGTTFGFPNGWPSNKDATKPFWCQTPGAVQVSDAYNISFIDDYFVGLGSVGMAIGQDDNAAQSGVGNATDNILVEGGLFTQIAAGAITVGGVQAKAHHPSDPRSVNQNITLSNNLVHDVGIDYRDAAGIFVTYTTHCVVSHNEVYNVPYSGINLGYGWGSNDEGGSEDYQGRGLYQYQPIYTTPTTAKNNQIVANYVHDNMQLMNDGGCLYQLGAQPGTVFSRNHCASPAHSAGSNFSIYSDEGTRYLTFTQNVFSGYSGWGNQNASGPNETGNLTFNSNWLGGAVPGSRSCPASYSNSGPTFMGNPTGTVMVPSLVSTWTAGDCSDIANGNTTLTGGPLPADAQTIADAAGLEPMYRNLADAGP